jgi:tyrosine-protein kinase Etk/Wzc
MTQPTSDPFFEADQPVNLRLILYKYLLRYWYLYALCLAVAVGIAFTYLRYATRQYQVKSTILIKSPETTGAEVSEEFVLNELGLSSAAKNVQNEVQILKSRTLMLEVVHKLNLHVLYQMEGRVTTSEVYTNSPVIVDYAQPADSLKGLTIQVQQVDTAVAQIIADGKSMSIAFGDTLRLHHGEVVLRRHPLLAGIGDNQLFIRFVDPRGDGPKLFRPRSYQSDRRMVECARTHAQRRGAH